MSKLGDILQEKVLAEIDKILAEAETKSKKIVQQAESDASARLAAHRKKTEAQLHTAVRREQSAAELAIAIARTRARGQVMEQVKQKALNTIEEIPSKPDYGKILEALAVEAENSLKAAEAVVVNPSDAEKLSDWAMQKGLELLTDPEIRCGVRVISGHGKSVENTLPERLNRAWDTLASSVAKLLWE